MRSKIEQIEQEKLVKWLEYNLYTFTAIPLDTYTPSFAQKVKNKKIGVRAGFPDLCVILKRKSLLFIEMKLPKKQLKNWKLSTSNSKVSDYQKAWVEKLNELQNVEAFVAYWSDEAINIINTLENL